LYYSQIAIGLETVTPGHGYGDKEGKSMRIHDVIQATGLSKKTIHHYVQEGLLHPETEENGYLDFSESDVEILNFICFLRSMNLSLKEIGSILYEPEIARFLLSKRQISLQKEVMSLNRQNERITNLLNMMISCPSLPELLAASKQIRSEDKLVSDSVELLSETDVDIIANHFFGNYLKNIEMTEYRKYLFKRIKEYLFQNQTAELIRFRNYLLSLPPDATSDVYLNAARSAFEEVAALDSNGIECFVQKMILQTKENLSHKNWVKLWRDQYHEYIHPATVCYDGDVSLLMCELSPQFANYQKNVRSCCTVFFDYLQSEHGSALKSMLLITLDGHIDIYKYHHTDLMGLYCFR